jgi:hypothetical protein
VSRPDTAPARALELTRLLDQWRIEGESYETIARVLLNAWKAAERQRLASLAGRASQASGNARRWTADEARAVAAKGGLAPHPNGRGNVGRPRKGSTT